MRILPSLLAAAALAAAVAAPAAQADSIAYVKDGNVWLSTPDGARQFQVTTTGGYSDVSQADDGTMIALHGVRLHRLDRLGDVLADFDTPVSDLRPAGSRTFFGPFDPAISPDGTKVAYTYYYMTTSQTSTCFPPQCVTAINEGGTGYSHADKQTSWDEAGFHEHSGWRNPIWTDNTTTVLSDPTHLPNDDVVVDQPASRAGDTGFLVQGWFSDTVGGNPHLSGGDVTRDKTKLAYVTGENDSTLTLYRVGTFPTAFKDGEADASTRPDVCYRYSGAAGGAFGTPSFSPDGGKLAYTEGDGIHVVTVPSFASGCTTDGASTAPAPLIAGATQPDWGPADVPAGRPSTPSPSPSPSPAPGAKAKLTVTGVKLATALRKGLKVRLTGASASTITAKAGGKVVARGKGTGTVVLKFTAKAKRALRHKAKVRLAITAGAATATVTLRR